MADASLAPVLLKEHGEGLSHAAGEIALVHPLRDGGGARRALLAHALAVIRNRVYGGQVDAGQVAAAALYHDASEIITGDMPTPIKYYAPEIRDAYKKVEAVACGRLLAMLPDELRPDYDDVLDCADGEVLELVKAADKLSAYIKCVEELKAGNAEFRRAAEQTRAALDAMHLPELDYFMEHCAESFSMTLDELE